MSLLKEEEEEEEKEKKNSKRKNSFVVRYRSNEHDCIIIYRATNVKATITVDLKNILICTNNEGTVNCFSLGS